MFSEYRSAWRASLKSQTGRDRLAAVRQLDRSPWYTIQRRVLHGALRHIR